MKIKVFKFGGSSVQDPAHIKNVEKILAASKKSKLVVVISALGKMTNALESVWSTYLKDKKSAKNQLEEIINEHCKIGVKLGLDKKEIKLTLQNLLDNNLLILKSNKLNSDGIYDQIISLGELFSTAIISKYFNTLGLNSKWLDVRNVIKTDSLYREAKVDLASSSKKINSKVSKLWKHDDIIVTQGFIAKNKLGHTTTLGREGSDYTAAIFAYALEVDELTIWKDVKGILTADPRKFDSVQLIKKLSYREAIEMTYFGAKVIHPKTIQPIQNKKIKLRVRSYKNLKAKGTVISDQGMKWYPPIVVIQDEVILLKISSLDFSFIAEDHLSLIFSNMNKHRIKLCVMRNSAISFDLCISKVEADKIKKFMKDLSKNFTYKIFQSLQLITIRHFNENMVKNLIKGKEVLLEETLGDTIQLVVRPV